MSLRRYLGAALVGLGAAMLLIGSIAVWQFGVSQTRTIAAQALDDWHITGQKTRLLRVAKIVDHADAVHDAEKAIRGGDKRLLGVVCPGLSLPGVDEHLYQEYRDRLGVNVVLVGSLEWPEWKRYREAVVKYAERYNRAVLQTVRP